jgi:arylsulfatase A-like enzyme
MTTEPQSADRRWTTRLDNLGDAATIALAVSLVCAVPTAVRSGGAGASMLDGLLVASAILLVLTLPLVLLKARAARGWRGLVSGPSRPLTVALALWVALAVLVLAVLAALLKAKTHHRALAGATFGVVGAAALVATAVVAVRATAFGRWLVQRGLPNAAATALIALVFAFPLGLVGWSLARSNGGARAAVFDLALVLAALGIAYWRSLPAALPRSLRLASLPAAVALMASGLMQLGRSPETGDAVQRGGGLVAGVLWALEVWSDQDGDGEGAHFGGRDCDEGDPTRHGGATDKAEDGVDSDCDGRDEAAPVHLVAAAPPPPPEVVPQASAQSASAEVAAHELTSEGRTGKPDLVLVTLDNVGAGHCSSDGYSRATTPTLAALAKRGMRFAHAYAPGSETQQALMPLVSGKTLATTATTNTEWPALRAEVDTLAERLQAAGYATAAVVSFTWLRGDRGFAHGFEHFDESPFRDQHPERMVTGDRALAAAERSYQVLVKQPKPLFLWVHLFDAHSKFMEHKGISFGEGDRSLYDGEIAFVDKLVAKLVEHVARGPRADETLWVVHGSHGEAFGEHGDVGHGASLAHDEVLRVPLIVFGRGVKAAAPFERDAVSTLDIAPTLLDYAGGSASGFEGVSLRPALEGQAKFARPLVVARALRRTALIDWPLKLLVMHRKEARDRLLLFDLSADPGETKDLSADRPADLKRLDALRRR